MNRGDIYRVRERIPERGDQPGYYVVVSREFVVQNDRIGTVVCAPVYTRILGAATEVLVGPECGLPRASSIRCDFLMLLFKSHLKFRSGSLSADKIAELDEALAVALDLFP